MTAPVPRRPREVRRALKDLGLRPSRARGQNFLVDVAVPPRIAAACGCGPGDLVLEVGPGLGTLTASLLETGARVLAAELDHRLAERLRETLGDEPSLRIVEGDALDGHGGLAPALSAAIEDASSRVSGRLFVAANLPYSVGTTLVQALLDREPPPARLVVMVQKEVADRMKAEPGSRVYGGLSVLVQDRARVRTLFRVPPSAFRPPPEVQSAVVLLEPREDRTRGAARDDLLRVVRAAFAARRKTLANGLRHAGLLSAEAVAAAGIDPGRRAESLSVDEFRVLASLVPAGDGGDTGAP